jgi:hypothetical protein
MKAEDLSFKIIKVAGDENNWSGYFLYKDGTPEVAPIYPVQGFQFSSQYGGSIALNKALRAGEEFSKEKKAPDYGYFNINSFEHNGREVYTVKSIVKIFGLVFPVNGFVRITDGYKAIRVTLDEKSVEYYGSDKYFETCAAKGKEPTVLVLENNSVYSAEQLDTMRSNFAEFTEWDETFFPDKPSKVVRSEHDFIEPSSVKEEAKAKAKAAVAKTIKEEAPF